MICQGDIYERSFSSPPIPQFLMIIWINEVIFEALGYEVELVDSGGFHDEDETLRQGGFVPFSMGPEGLEEWGQSQSTSATRKLLKKLTSFVDHKEGKVSVCRGKNRNLVMR